LAVLPFFAWSAAVLLTLSLEGPPLLSLQHHYHIPAEPLVFCEGTPLCRSVRLDLVLLYPFSILKVSWPLAPHLSLRSVVLKIITLVSYAATATQPSFPTRNSFPHRGVFANHSFATPFLSSAWRPLKSLASLFQTPVLCFQPFAASFRKTPGVGVAPRRPFTVTSHEPRATQILLPLSFHGLTSCFSRMPFLSQSSASPPV
jgi:hypothetical protein